MNKCENYTRQCEAYDCCECDSFSWDGTGTPPKEHISKVINTRFSHFFQDWEIDLLIDACIANNVKNDDDILKEVDDYVTGIENSI